MCLTESIILIIPFHGIFLSIFFFLYAERNPVQNFYLGLMLLVLSAISILQYINDWFTCKLLPTSQFIFFESLISPFLFLYNCILIRSKIPRSIITFLLVFFTVITIFLKVNPESLIWKISLITLSGINILYLLASFYLLGDLIKRYSAGWKQLMSLEY